MKLFDVVSLVDPLPEEDLPAGSVGTVVHIFDRPRLAYEVEFVDDNGNTVAMATVRPDQIRAQD